jgi:hypothetical protein
MVKGYWKCINELKRLEAMDDYKKHLKKKDDKIHIILVDHISIGVHNTAYKYTDRVDAILTDMQNSGYEIINVQISPSFPLHTLITYK